MRQLSPDDSSSELEKLFEYYQQPIVRYLANLVHDQELARDLCQETFEHVLNHLSRQETTLPQTANYLKNWLYRIAKNRAIDYHRHNKLIDFLPVSDNEEPVPFDEDQICDLLWLQEAIALMPPKYRECLLAKHYWGYTQEEIAAQLGITESAVSSNVSHGKTHLRRKYFPVTIDVRVVEAKTALRRSGFKLVPIMANEPKLLFSTLDGVFEIPSATYYTHELCAMDDADFRRIAFERGRIEWSLADTLADQINKSHRHTPPFICSLFGH